MKKTLLALALIAAGTVQAGVITQSAALNLETTEIHQVFNINKFDATLGTLTGVSVTLNGEALSTVTLLNTAAQAQRFGFVSDLTLFLDGAGLSQTLALNLFTFPPTVLPVGVLTDLGTANPTGSLTFSASDLSQFIGTGTTSFTCESLVVNTQSGGGGNIRVTQATQAGCGLSVAYTYDTPSNPTPEPASMALVGLGMLGLAAVRRRK